jgi:hypothetical protein
MTRSILCGLLALVSVGALGLLPVACQSGGVGDPCTPEDEYNAQFPGFSVSDEEIESRSFQCATRICLVNHFQGRVSCPQGQDATTLVSCNGPNDTTTCKTTTTGKACVQSEVYAPTCNTCPAGDSTCVVNACPGDLQCIDGICQCADSDSGLMNGVQFTCAPFAGAGSPNVLVSYVCHKPNACQTVAGGATTANEGLDCCIPGTDTPVSVSVCGQCSPGSNRDANDAVYCSCRCCAPCCAPGTMPSDTNPCSTDTSTCGPACDVVSPGFNYCSCPSGFICSNIRQNVGLGFENLAGAYCIKTGTASTANDTATCGNVVGYDNPEACSGTSAPPTAVDGGP